MQGYAAPAGDVDTGCQRGNRDLRARTAQQVDGRHGLHLFETIRQDCENCGHAVTLSSMSVEADGILSGKRLVIFGCGYIGTAVATAARERGLNVTALTRNPTSAQVLREQDIEVVQADLATRDWHDHVAAAPEFALNCVSAGGAGLAGYEHSYVDGMKSLVAWARARGPVGTLVYTSSTSVYPQHHGDAVDESASTSGAGERGRILLEAENELRASRGACRRWFVLRLAGIYGPGRHHLLDQVRAGAVGESGEHHLNLAHRDDIVAAIWACFRAPPAVADEIFNVADDRPERKSEVIAWLADRLKVARPAPAGAPASGRRTTTPDRIIVNGRLKAVLGWSPRYPSFREGYEILLSR